MAQWIRVGHGMRYVAHTAFLGTLCIGCGVATVKIYSVGVEELTVSPRDPVIASQVSRHLRPSYLPDIPYATAFEYPVPLQWLSKTPDATELSRNVWLCWPFKLEQKWLQWRTSPHAQVSTRRELERDPLEPATNVLGLFDILDKSRDGSSILYRFGQGSDPRHIDGLHRFTVAIEDDLAVFGLSTAMWSATTPDAPSWMGIKVHELYARLLLKSAVQRMLRPKHERQQIVSQQSEVADLATRTEGPSTSVKG